MPKGRSFQSLAMTAPSVNSGEIEGGFQVNGASGAENAFTVDGVVTNSLINGSSRQNTVFEYLQEVQVKTTGIAAEYGGALGGVISAVTKSGGNTFRGEAHYLLRGLAPERRPGQAARARIRRTTSRVTYEQDSKAPDHRNEIGGSLGGPIVKDKLFFFGSYSPRFARRTNDYPFSTARSTGEIKRSQDLTQVFGKVTYSSQPHHGVGLGALHADDLGGHAARLQRRRHEHHHQLAGGQRGQPASAASSRRRPTPAATSTSCLSNSSFLSVRGGYFLDNYNDTGIPNTTNYIYQTSSVGMAGVPASCRGPIGTQNTPRALIVDKDTTNRSFFNADYNNAFHAAGYHTLKGGFG